MFTRRKDVNEEILSLYNHIQCDYLSKLIKIGEYSSV